MSFSLIMGELPDDDGDSYKLALQQSMYLSYPKSSGCLVLIREWKWRTVEKPFIACQVLSCRDIVDCERPLWIEY